MQNRSIKLIAVIVCLSFFSISLTSCAPFLDSSSQYNRPYRGGFMEGLTLAFGAVGAGLGQLVGHNTMSTLIGMGSGALFGMVAGSIMDLKYERQAARIATQNNKPVVLQDKQNRTIVAIPNQTYTEENGLRCQVTTVEVWDKQKLVKKTFKKVCQGEIREKYKQPGS